MAMSSDELDRHRGGFSLGPFMLNLGIQITTTVNDAVTVQTVLTVEADLLGAQLSSGVSATGAGGYLPAVDITQLANGAAYVLDGTTITHQLQNGITAAVQNTAEGVSVDQTVALTVGLENYHAVMAGTGAARQAALWGDEIARLGALAGH